MEKGTEVVAYEGTDSGTDIFYKRAVWGWVLLYPTHWVPIVIPSLMVGFACRASE